MIQESPLKKKQTLQLWSKVIVGVIPAAVIGLLLDDIIEGYLSANFVIAVALIAYGIIFILVEKNPRQEKIETIEQVDYLSALKIGCFQCLALIKVLQGQVQRFWVVYIVVVLERSQVNSRFSWPFLSCLGRVF